MSGVEQGQIVSKKVISEEQAVAEVFNKFFINIVPNLKIPTNHSYDTDFLVTNDQVANALNKFRNHPSIIMIKNKRKTDQWLFLWSSNMWRYIEKKNNFDTAKASQQSDIPAKVLKQNSDYFAGYFCGNINHCISKSMLPPDLQLADVTPVYKINQKILKIIIGQWVSYPAYLRFVKDVFMIHFRFSSILFCPNISAGFKEANKNTAW